MIFQHLRTASLLILMAMPCLASAPPESDRVAAPTASSQGGGDSAASRIADLLLTLSGEHVESLGPFNISIGGYYVSGLGDRSNPHPLLRQDAEVVEALLLRIRTKVDARRARLLYNGIHGRITRLEVGVMMLMPEVVKQELHGSRGPVLGHAAGQISRTRTDVAQFPILSDGEAEKIIDLVVPLSTLEASPRNHLNFSVGPYLAFGTPEPNQEPHPLLAFGEKALPFLAVAIASESQARTHAVHCDQQTSSSPNLLFGSKQWWAVRN